MIFLLDKNNSYHIFHDKLLNCSDLLLFVFGFHHYKNILKNEVFLKNIYQFIFYQEKFD